MSITIHLQLAPPCDDDESLTEVESESDATETTSDSETEDYPCTVIIYKIFQTTDPTMMYVGSTVATLAERIRGHKRACADPDRQNKLYRHINSLPGRWADMTISLVHEYQNCPDKLTHLATERKWCRHHSVNLNSVIPGALVDICDGDLREYAARLYRQNAKLRAARKARSKESLTTRYRCKCGSQTSKSNQSHHRRTTMHLEFLREKNMELPAPPTKRTRYEFSE